MTLQEQTDAGGPGASIVNCEWKSFFPGMITEQMRKGTSLTELG